MKKLLTLLFISLFAINYSFSQSDCNPYYTLKEGKKWTIKSYNEKDKYQGKQSYEILSVEEVLGELTAVIKIITYDKKDKESLNKEVSFECKDGVIKMDMSTVVPAEVLESFKTMEVEMEMEQMSIPNELSVGQVLDEGSLKMTIIGPIPMKMGFKVKDRKVESKETVSVPAGEYSAFKISSTTEMNGMFNRENKNIEYVAEGVGVVKSESYDKKGKLQFYSVLTEYTE